MTERLIREINRRMEKLGLTPITLAKKAGLGRDAVRDILRGKSLRPAHDTLQAIARALGCTVADLMGERTPPPMPRALTENVTVNELDVHTRAGLGADGEAVVMHSMDASQVRGEGVHGARRRG